MVVAIVFSLVRKPIVCPGFKDDLDLNGERPHEELGTKCPAEIYIPSPRAYRGLPDLTYPFHVASRAQPRRTMAMPDGRSWRS